MDGASDLALTAAAAGGDVAAEYFRTTLAVETKSGKTDVVTRADREAQERIASILAEERPDDAFVGEEDDALTTIPPTGPAWVVDPIDGTNNFVRGNPTWCTSVAHVVEGEAIGAANVLPAIGDSYVAGPDGVRRNGDPVSVSDRADPETFAVVPTIWWDFDRRDEYAAATKAIVDRFGDLRRIGSAQVALSMLAAGTLEGVLTNVDPNPWDTVAGAFMVEQAGGTVTDIEGDPWRHDSRGLVASNGRAHEAVLAAAREAETARSNDRQS